MKLSRCDKLTRLEILFEDNVLVDGVDMPSNHVLQELIKNIHSVPSLEHVRFIYTSIRLVDLETLHQGLPRLKALLLDFITLYQNDWIDTNGVSPKSSVESFLCSTFIW